jgi:hypothetical protein
MPLMTFVQKTLNLPALHSRWRDGRASIGQLDVQIATCVNYVCGCSFLPKAVELKPNFSLAFVTAAKRRRPKGMWKAPTPISTGQSKAPNNFQSKLPDGLKHHPASAVTEGLNSKIQGIKSAARGFRNFKNHRTRLLFFCGNPDLCPL